MNKTHQLSLFNWSSGGGQPVALQPASAAPPVFITPEEMFAAYFECRKNKRNTINALAFEHDYEKNLMDLMDDVNQQTYKVGRSVAFIVNKPVKREIFCADFRDRVVHHLLIGKLNPLFEKLFITDSYSCRKGKGTLYGMHRVEQFLRSCSHGYTRDCYIMKMDVEGYFMNISRPLLFEKVTAFIEANYKEGNRPLILDLCRKIILNDPTENCYVKGNPHNWDDLPLRKSLLKMREHGNRHRGLPIGNLTSQIFANFYLHAFDHYMKHDLHLKYYGRYVDDIIVVHEDKPFLLQVREQAAAFLQSQLDLRIHAKKTYLQHYSKGVAFLGAYILPHHMTPGRRIKGNLSQKVHKWNKCIREQCGRLQAEQIGQFQSQINSYLGFMLHHCSYRLRKKMVGKKLSAWFDNYITTENGCRKLSLRLRRVKKSQAFPLVFTQTGAL